MECGYFTDKAELWKKEIQATDVNRLLTITDPQLQQSVKILIRTQRLINLDRYETAAEQYRMLYALLPESAAIAIIRISALFHWQIPRGV